MADVADPTARFSGRADDYLESRPAYPPGVLETLVADCGLTSTSRIADVGAGTGILTTLLLQHGNPVFAVEPNEAMRAALGKLRAAYPSLRVVDAPAESTSLPAASVDFVIVAQAFHWFDAERVREEFGRILRPGGRVVLLWNIRDTESTGFLRGYENLLRRFAPEYQRFKDGPIDLQVLSRFFAPSGYVSRRFPNELAFDLPRLERLVRSTSYAPCPGQPGFDAMIEALHELFADHQVAGNVSMRYQTHMYFGGL